MTLPKKFLHSNISSLGISKSRFIIGVSVAILFSLSFYSLSTITREILRVFSTTENNDVWILSESENNFYNLFYAFISVIFGQSICFSLWLSKKRKILGRHRFLRSSIMIDQSVLNSYFVLWFTKMAFMFACFFGLDGLGGFYVFSFYPDYNYLFILIIVVLFFQSWVTIRRIFKNQSLKWILVSILVVSGLSFSLSKINIVDYESINKSLQKNNPFHNYELQIPESSVYQRLENRSRVLNIYLVKNLKNKNLPKTILITEKKTFELNDLDQIISGWREGCWEIDIPRLTYQLHIDTGISMKEVNKLRLKLSSLYALKIAYAVIPDKKEFDRRYYRNYAFYVKIPPTWTNGELPPPPIQTFAYENIILLDISENNKYIVKGQMVKVELLKDILKKLIDQNTNYIVDLSTGEDVNFGSYFIALQSYRKAIEDLRNEYSIKTFYLNFKDLDEERMQMVRHRYPFAVYEDIFYKKALN
jgi:hypothetical protein